MRVTSARGIIAHEITKAIVIAESERRLPLDLVKRQVIRESIDKYYKDSFGHSLTEFRQVKLEIDLLNEELDEFLAADLPNLSESLSENPKLLREGAVLPTWVNMILPFVGMAADTFLPGSGAVLDVVNSLDMFFGATSTFEYILSGIFLVMAIPAVGDALGVTLAPVVWIADKVAKAKGLMGQVIKQIMSKPWFTEIAKKVTTVIQPLLNGFKPGGKVFEFIKNLWVKIPVNKAGEFAKKMKGEGGAAGVLGKMAGYLQKGIDMVRKMVGLGVQKASVALSKIMTGPQVRALEQLGVKSLDDIAAAEVSVLNTMGKQSFGKVSSATKTLEVQTASGITKTITNDLGMGVKSFVVKKGPDGADEVFAVIHKASGIGSGPGRMKFNADAVLGKMRSGIHGGSPSGYIPVKNLPKSMIDDLGLGIQMNQLGVIGAARANALKAGVDAARVVPKIPTTTAAPMSRVRTAATDAAGRVRTAATDAAGRVRTAATDAAGRAVRSPVGSAVIGGAGAGAVMHGAGTFEREGTRASVAENRLTSSSAYLDGIIDLKSLIG